MRRHQLQFREEMKQRALMKNKMGKKSSPSLNLKKKVISGELSVKAAMNKLISIPDGKNTSTWSWLQKRMQEKN